MCLSKTAGQRSAPSSAKLNGEKSETAASLSGGKRFKNEAETALMACFFPTSYQMPSMHTIYHLGVVWTVSIFGCANVSDRPKVLKLIQ